MTVIWAARLMRKGKVFEYSSVLCYYKFKSSVDRFFDFEKDKNNPTSKHDHTLEDKKFADPINYLQRE